jgi:hypothetical protein
MIFVEKALFNMKKNSKAVILIQENAGAGKGTPYTKEILKHSTLLASIKMNPQVFIGKSNVQTAIYVFHVGTGGHKKDNIVKFFNMTEDGYSRLNRPKSKQSVNLKNTDHAIERYNEVLNKVLNRETETSYYTKENGNYIEDTISLEGNDWTFTQHQIIDITPTENDFRKTIGAYLSWQASQLLNME